MEIVSEINFLGLVFILVMSAMMLLLQRRYAFIPMILTTCVITFGQTFVLGGLHFTAMRLVILVGWVRLIMRREISIKLNPIDKMLICWVISSLVAYTFLYQTMDAFINRLGFAYNAIGLYFLFRLTIRDFDDVDRGLKTLAIVVIPLAILMLFEKATGNNLFSIFGGVPNITVVREGALRCQGPFRHPILAGTFGATLIPLIITLWFKGNNNKLLATIGFVAATIITVTAASSGPPITYLIGLTGLVMWHFRRHMRAIRWGILFTLISLHLIMKAPVWYLISRASEVVGGTGWHRSYLIDQAIKHFGEWWMLGTKYTGDWMPYNLAAYPDKADITNQYIAEGVNGGFLTMILFITIIVICFRTIGRALLQTQGNQFAIRITIWSMGAALFAHVISFLSISYFDQIVVIWYILLAMISLLGSNIGLSKVATR